MIKLTEIPFKGCTDSLVFFSIGNKIDTDVSITIESARFDPNLFDDKPSWGANGSILHRRIASIKYLYLKYQLRPPDSAFIGLYEPNLCHVKLEGTKAKRTTDCKVFRSEDKRRMYIYMLNGEGMDRYEVTWIIHNSKYYARVVDSIP